MTRSLVGLVWLLMALVLPAGGSAGEPLSAGDRAAIRGVIEAQLAAFRADASFHVRFDFLHRGVHRVAKDIEQSLIFADRTEQAETLGS